MLLPTLYIAPTQALSFLNATAPTLQSEQLYTRISAAQVRRQLIEQKGYRDEDLPTAEVIRQRLNQMGYRQLRVAKTKPQKTIAETEAILAEVNRVNAAADADARTLRISMDAKAMVKVGNYSSRFQVGLIMGDYPEMILALLNNFTPTDKRQPLLRNGTDHNGFHQWLAHLASSAPFHNEVGTGTANLIVFGYNHFCRS